MNIVFLFWKNLNPTTGGVERVTDLLCRELKRRGHNVLYLNNTLYSINGDNYELFPRPDFTPTHNAIHKNYRCIAQQPAIPIPTYV